MSAIATLTKQLKYYKRLKFHRDPKIAEYLVKVQDWQKNRMQHVHQQLFSQTENQLISQFLLMRLYHLQDMQMLAQQLDKALREKIKLERFLPDSVLDTAILGFRLAYLTIRLDEQIAIYLLEHNIEQIEDEHIFEAFRQLDQFKHRDWQLKLFKKLSLSLQHYGRNILLQSAFRLAKRTAYRRDFIFLYHYLSEAFKAIRSTSKSNSFFDSFIQQEKRVIVRIQHQHPNPLEPIPQIPPVPVQT